MTQHQLPEHCLFCQSTNIKRSFAYPTDWFCTDCKHGGVISEQQQSYIDKLLISRKFNKKIIQTPQKNEWKSHLK
jgi:ribosomal protein L37AE/L43A